MTIEKLELPLLPLRDIVVFPFMVIPLFVGREKSVRALEKAMAEQKNIFLSAQRNPSNNDPTPGEIYETGTLANILIHSRLQIPAVPLKFINKCELLFAFCSIKK